MNVARTWVFPILRIVLVAVVAAALVKLAFFPDREAQPEAGLVPTGTVSEPEFVVARGSIANDLTLQGTVNADAAVAAKATGTGTVDEVFAANGSQVAAGDVIYDIKVQNEVEPVEEVGPDGVPVVTIPKATYRFEKVRAPIAGVVSLDVLPGQAVAIGDARASVAPPSFNVTATLSPEQQYRLTDAPAEARVVIAGGPAPFTCTGLTISTGSAANGGAGGGDGLATGASEGGSTSGTTVRCTVPGDVRVFPGLSAQVTISAGVADGVLVVPTTSVEGGAETGTVWLVQPDGERVEQPVRLGLTDGLQVEVVEGLAEGDTVLEFVPGAPEVPAGMEGCDIMPDGTVICTGASGSMH